MLHPWASSLSSRATPAAAASLRAVPGVGKTLYASAEKLAHRKRFRSRRRRRRSTLAVSAVSCRKRAPPGTPPSRMEHRAVVKSPRDDVRSAAVHQRGEETEVRARVVSTIARPPDAHPWKTSKMLIGLLFSRERGATVENNLRARETGSGMSS